MTSLDELKKLSPSERKQVMDQIIKSGILLQKAEPDEVMEISITITETPSVE